MPELSGSNGGERDQNALRSGHTRVDRYTIKGQKIYQPTMLQGKEGSEQRICTDSQVAVNGLAGSHDPERRNIGRSEIQRSVEGAC